MNSDKPAEVVYSSEGRKVRGPSGHKKWVEVRDSRLEIECGYTDETEVSSPIDEAWFLACQAIFEIADARKQKIPNAVCDFLNGLHWPSEQPLPLSKSESVLTADLGMQMRNVDFSGTRCGGTYSYVHGGHRRFAVECGKHVVVLSEAMAWALAAEVAKADQ